MTVGTVVERILNREPELIVDLVSWLIFLKDYEYQLTLSNPERQVIALNDLVRQTLNGGFDQFFYNSGQWANDVLPALNAIDEKQIQTIYQEVFNLYSRNMRVPEDREERVDLIEMKSRQANFASKVKALDDRFSELFRTSKVSDELVRRMVEFISINKSAFTFDDKVYKRWLNPELAEKFPGDAAYLVNLRDGDLRISDPAGNPTTLDWAALTKISIVKHGKSRIGLFPWHGPKCPFSGYSWKFSSKESECSAPFYARHGDEFVEKLFDLPGFDPTTLIEQERYLLCPTGTERVCWAR